jgi:pimeloyl-ACP methyl ester carboxylesterase
VVIRRRALAALGVVAMAVALPARSPAGADDEELRTVPTRPGVTESLLLVHPPGRPVASVILLAGGDGVLALGSLWNFRTSREHAANLRAAIAALREIAPVPAWLVGTSMGTLSAASGAARLRDGGPDGIVLTSTVSETSRLSGESVRHVALGDVRVPVLVVHHRHDACRASPYAWAAYLPRALARAPARELLTYDGGDPPISDPCEAESAHGYLGLEPQVVAAIAAWIRAH